MSDGIRSVAFAALVMVLGAITVGVHAQPCQLAWDTAIGQVGTPPGMSGPVNALTVFDDGGGPALYAGGLFAQAGGVTVNNIAEWDGMTWSALGVGPIKGTNSVIYALTVFDDGGGAALYAGGFFDQAGGFSANRIAKWDGGFWWALGAGVSSSVTSLAVFNGALYVGGQFTSAGGSGANRIAEWDGATWTALGGGLNNIVSTLVATDLASAVGPGLYVGGNFSTAGGLAAARIAKWDGASWSALAGGGMNSQVLALAFYDDGSGPVLCAGGKFTTAGGVGANYIAQWDGTWWAPLGAGMNNSVLALAVYDDGTGPALYAGGKFTTAGGAPANHIAKWDGAAWSSLDGGADGNVQSLGVSTEPALDEGLFVGGFFTQAGDESASRIARWGCTRGDCDGNGYVDLEDYADFHDCLTGPNGGPLLAECRCADFDLDDDTDLADHRKFQQVFTGPP